MVIEGTGYEARKTSKEQTKLHDGAQSFVLRSYTMSGFRNQNVSTD